MKLTKFSEKLIIISLKYLDDFFKIFILCSQHFCTKFAQKFFIIFDKIFSIFFYSFFKCFSEFPKTFLKNFQNFSQNFVNFFLKNSSNLCKISRHVFQNCLNIPQHLSYNFVNSFRNFFKNCFLKKEEKCTGPSPVISDALSPHLWCYKSLRKRGVTIPRHSSRNYIRQYLYS